MVGLMKLSYKIPLFFKLYKGRKKILIGGFIFAACSTVLARYLLKLGYKDTPTWRLGLVLNSARMRIYINIKAPDRSAPKFDQAFLISINRTDLSDGVEYLKFLERSWYEDNDIPRPQVLGTFFDVKIEFERSLAAKLNKIIPASRGETEKSLRQAFLNDQTAILETVAEKLEDLKAKTFDRDKNQYQTARQFTQISH